MCACVCLREKNKRRTHPFHTCTPAPYAPTHTPCPGGYVSLDASKPWLCYWILHGLHLLKADPYDLFPRIISTLSHMQNDKDGA